MTASGFDAHALMVRGRLDRSTRAWRESRRAAAVRAHLRAHLAKLDGKAAALDDIAAICCDSQNRSDASLKAQLNTRLESIKASRTEMQLLIEREAPERALLESVRHLCGAQIPVAARPRPHGVETSSYTLSNRCLGGARFSPGHGCHRHARLRHRAAAQYFVGSNRGAAATFVWPILWHSARSAGALPAPAPLAAAASRLGCPRLARARFGPRRLSRCSRL